MIKRKKGESVYFTLRMNGPRTNPLAVASAVKPSSQVAETTMFVLPKPRMNPALIASSPAGAPA